MVMYRIEDLQDFGRDLKRDREGNTYTSIVEWLRAWRRDGRYKTVPAKYRRKLAREVAAQVRAALRRAKAAQKGAHHGCLATSQGPSLGAGRGPSPT